MNSTLNSAITRVARRLCVDRKLVENVYKSYWNFIKTTVSDVSLIDMSEEEFNSTDINFNLPMLGKLFVEYDKIERRRRHLKYLENAKIEESEANRLSGSGD